MAYLVIMLSCIAVFYRTLKYDIVVDDDYFRHTSKVNNPKYKNKILRLHALLKGLHPVKSKKLDHVITLAIHTAVCMLIYTAFGSLAVSLLFAFNLSNNQVSIWMNGKRYGFNTILCLLSYILLPIGGVFFWFLTPFFQPNAILFPLILALKGHWWLPIIIPLGLLVGNCYLIKWAKFRSKMIPVDELKDWHPRKLVFILKTYAFYFFRGIVPVAPSMYLSYLGGYGFDNDNTEKVYKADWITAIGGTVVFLIPLLYLYYPVIMFGFMWWLITISIYNNWKTITVPFGERYMYLPNIGLMLGLVQVLNLLHPYLWLLVLGAYLGRLDIYIPMYTDMSRYLKHHTDVNPTNDTPWVFRVNQASVANDVELALARVNEGLSYCPESPRLWLHKAAISNVLRDKELAMNCINSAKKHCIGNFGKLFIPKIEAVEQQIKGNKEK